MVEPVAPAPQGLLRRHWLITSIIVVGVVVRALAMIAYSPALLFPDSWGYIGSALSGGFVRLPTEHPIGYPILLRLLTLPDRSLAELVGFQHLAVIAAGLAIYVTLLRSRLPRWAAAAAAALVLLDGYSITLEQYVMSDTFFTTAMLASVLVLAWPWLAPIRRDDGEPTAPGSRQLLLRSGGAGLLVAIATLIREVAPFTVPVFLIYLLWARTGWRPIVAFIVAAALPLILYSALIDNDFHVFGLTATPGWTLYGRVAGFADCNGLKLKPAAQRLCQTKAQRASHPSAPDWYIWGPSPARRMFNPGEEPAAQIAPTNKVLESFDHAVIKHQPLAFIGASLSDFLRYFTPGAVPYNDAISATSLPRSAGKEARDPAVRTRDLPRLKVTLRSPSGFVRAYRGVVHAPRPILALLALAAVLGVCLRIPARREVFLLAGSALVILLGTAATGGFALRYLLPAVPLLAIGGSLAGAQLIERWRPLSRRARSVRSSG